MRVKVKLYSENGKVLEERMYDSPMDNILLSDRDILNEYPKSIFSKDEETGKIIGIINQKHKSYFPWFTIVGEEVVEDLKELEATASK